MKNYIIIIMCAMLVCFGCSGKTADNSAPASAQAKQQVAVTPEAHKLISFWDEADFNDTITWHNEELLQQNFIRFISGMPDIEQEELRQQAFAAMIDKAAADPKILEMLTFMGERYLYSPDSPFLADNLYMDFLEAWTSSDKLSDTDLIRPRALLEQAKKNLPGTRATDFAYTDRDGNQKTLLNSLDGKTLLLIFYDPDCDHCRKVFKQFGEDPGFNADLASGAFTVLAIYAGDDKDEWKKNLDMIPTGWAVGISPDVDENELYIVRSTPEMYFIDANGTVIEKDLFPQ